MDEKRTPRPFRVAGMIAAIIAAVVLAGCASVLEGIEDGLPVTHGEMEEAVTSINEVVDGSTSGNPWVAGGGAAGALGIALIVARRMIRRSLEKFDEAPFEGPGGTTLPEDELVARVQALPSPQAPVSKSSL